MFDDCEMIYGYSRAQAIADSNLIDVSTTAREAGVIYPCALTHAAWEATVAWSSEDNAQKGTAQDEAGRLWDVVWMYSRAAKRADGSTITYSLYVVPRSGKARLPRLTRLKAIVGPGDTPEPVVTIMLPGED